jgi:hypothetical protein
MLVEAHAISCWSATRQVSYAFTIPAAWLWFTDRAQIDQPLGLVIFAVGVGGLFWCVRDFYISGKGKHAPWTPSQKLIIVGLYR